MRCPVCERRVAATFTARSPERDTVTVEYVHVDDEVPCLVVRPDTPDAEAAWEAGE